MCCKSPLMDTWGDANGSGFFGLKLKAARFGGVLFHGMRERPVMLGPKLLLSDLDGLLEIVDLCNRYGLEIYSLVVFSKLLII